MLQKLFDILSYLYQKKKGWKWAGLSERKEYANRKRKVLKIGPLFFSCNFFSAVTA